MPAASASYWRSTRAPRYSITFALPLLILYEALAAALEGPKGGLRNGADAILHALTVGAFGEQGSLVITAAVIGLCTVWVIRDAKRNGGINARWFPLMLLESTALAFVFAVVVGIATAQLLTRLGVTLMVPGPGGAEMDRGTALMLSLGAGLYEELLFRVLLVSGLAAGARIVLGTSQVVSGAIASVIGALVFSAFHYVGAYGDPFTVQSFTFRAIAGLAFSALYLLRGFGITAWTHALYDIGVMVL